jgi:hypothetical protein
LGSASGSGPHGNTQQIALHQEWMDRLFSSASDSFIPAGQWIAIIESVDELLDADLCSFGPLALIEGCLC